MKKLLFLMVVSLVLAGVAGANTVWNPASGGYVTGDVAPWDEVPTLWANGTPVSSALLGDPKAVFNLADPAECLVANEAVWGTLVMGDNGAASPQNAILRIVDGGTLTLGSTSSWISIGHTRDAGSMIVERGGEVYADSHFRVGTNSGGMGRLVMNGGYVYVDDNFQFGRNANSAGFVDLNSGLIDGRYTSSSEPGTMDIDGGTDNGPSSLMNIKFGKMKLRDGEDSDYDNLKNWIDTGHCVAWGGSGTVILEEDSNGDWTLSADPADDPQLRVPSMDTYAYTDAALDLSWVNLAPIAPATEVWMDVYFGTDMSLVQGADANLPPEYVDFPKIVDAQLGTAPVPSVDASSDNQEYMWRVDTYRNGDPAVAGNYTPFPDDGDPNTSEDALYEVEEGMLMYFRALDDKPIAGVVIDTPSMVTWAGEPIHLSATITDDNLSPVPITVVWSAEDTSGGDDGNAGPLVDPNAVFSAETLAYNGDGTWTATADVIVNYHSAGFSVSLEANDSSSAAVAASGSSSHDCARSACQATYVLDLGKDGDVDANCVIDLVDAAELAIDWTHNYTLPGPTVITDPPIR